MTLLIAGSRLFKDYDLFKLKCDYYLQNRNPEVIIYDGGGASSDLIARYGAERGVPIEHIPYYFGPRGYPDQHIELARRSDFTIWFEDGRDHEQIANLYNELMSTGKPIRVVQVDVQDPEGWRPEWGR